VWIRELLNFKGEKSETHSIKSVPLRFGLPASAADKPAAQELNNWNPEYSTSWKWFPLFSTLCMYVCMYVRMYVYMYEGRAIKSCPCTATYNDLLCFPFN
jgi:hypothetical protein